MENDYITECILLDLEPLEERGGFFAWLNKLMDELSKQDAVGPAAKVKKAKRAGIDRIENEIVVLHKQYPIEKERPPHVVEMIAALEKAKRDLNKG